VPTTCACGTFIQVWLKLDDDDDDDQLEAFIVQHRVWSKASNEVKFFHSGVKFSFWIGK